MSILVNREDFRKIRLDIKASGKKLVFTNGVFDLIHAGHVDYLIKAKALGDLLIVALNSDKSVKRIKGEKRPILQQDERAFIISNLKPVDYVTFFEEDTPKEIIDEIIPDILVKGADWPLDKIVGRDVVEANGGEVKAIEFVNLQSTSKIIESIVAKYDK
jgi:D-glycero-beta-D-manno-heptose 1-phosphate adenylyltransferase